MGVSRLLEIRCNFVVHIFTTMKYFTLFLCLLWHDQTFCQTYRVRNQVNHAQGPLSISPDNQLIVLASETSIMADIWDVRTGQFITSVQLPDTLIQNTLRYETHVCFGWQNNLLIGLSKKKEFWVYDWQLNKTVGKITGPINHSTEYIFSKNRKLLALKNNQDKKNFITIVDCVSGKQKTVLQLPANRLLVSGSQSLLFSPDQKLIFVAVDKGESLCFDAETGVLLHTLPFHPLIIDAKTKQSYGWKDGQILAGLMDNPQSISLFGKAQNNNAPSRFSLSPDGNVLAESNPANGPIRLWDRTKKEIIGQVDSYAPQFFTFINNTTLLCDEKQIRYRNIQKNDERSLAQDNHIYDVRFGGFGNDVWVSKKKTKLIKFSIDSTACFALYDFDGLSTDLFDINKSGSRFVLNHGSGWVRLFDAKSMTLLRKSTIGPPEQATNESIDLLRFSPNQKYIGVVYSDKIGFRLLNADNLSVKWAFKPLESRSFVSDSYQFSFSGSDF